MTETSRALDRYRNANPNILQGPESVAAFSSWQHDALLSTFDHDLFRQNADLIKGKVNQALAVFGTQLAEATMTDFDPILKAIARYEGQVGSVMASPNIRDSITRLYANYHRLPPTEDKYDLGRQWFDRMTMTKGDIVLANASHAGTYPVLRWFKETKPESQIGAIFLDEHADVYVPDDKPLQIDDYGKSNVAGKLIEAGYLTAAAFVGVSQSDFIGLTLGQGTQLHASTHRHFMRPYGTRITMTRANMYHQNGLFDRAGFSSEMSKTIHSLIQRGVNKLYISFDGDVLEGNYASTEYGPFAPILNLGVQDLSQITPEAMRTLFLQEFGHEPNTAAILFMTMRSLAQASREVKYPTEQVLKADPEILNTPAKYVSGPGLPYWAVMHTIDTAKTIARMYGINEIGLRNSVGGRVIGDLSEFNGPDLALASGVGRSAWVMRNVAKRMAS